jgi:mono/diheme cytochrome c family protein
MNSCRRFLFVRTGCFAVTGWLLSVWITHSVAFGAGPGTTGKIDFNRDIRPLLADNCYQCHGPDAAKRKAGLRLDQRAGATATLESGHSAVVPGKPEASRLLELVATADAEDRMPPAKTGKRLTAEQVSLLTRWVQEGAEWKPHWAYITPEKPQVPEAGNSSWPRTEIDRFLVARMEKEGLQPSAPADPRTLVRRVTMDLTGLPPTIDEVDSFLADSSDAGYERLVDRLLASQAYGERMAVPWLDLARFADSDGYHADAPRSMWQYRDWVIGSFNRNQRFDQFIVEQLAGDLLPNPSLEQRIATAFNRNGMSSTEGGADPDEYMNKYVTDRVNTFGTVFLGSSIQCAECHSHKYDPFTQREYYQLYDYFNRIPERGLDSDPAPPFVKVPTDGKDELLAKARLEVRVLASVLEEKLSMKNDTWERDQALWEKGLIEGLTLTEGYQWGEWQRVGPFVEADGKTAYGKEYGPEKSVDLGMKFADGKLSWGNPPGWKDGVIQSLSGDVGATYLYRTVQSESAKTITLYLGSDDALRVWHNGKEVHAKDTSRGVAPNQDEVKIDLVSGPNQLVFKVVNYGGAAGFYFSTVKEAGDEKRRKLQEIARLAPADRKPEQATELRRSYRETSIPEIRKLTADLAAARKTEGDIDRSIPTIRVMEDMGEGRPSHIRVRGDYRSKGEQVTADVPKSCLPPARESGTTNRLDLAQWLIDPSHPLTARVAVNRFWGLFFPHPIVKTANEFGTNGELPSHPELLDWLAREFIDNGWNTKALVRQIVLSAAYRQTSKVSAEHYGRDPQNRFLARGPRFRLSAEMVRDNALAISGLLVRKVGGPSVRPYQPAGLWEEKMFAGNKYDVGKGDELYRRSLYTLWKRTVPNPTLQTFDAPDRAICTVMRPNTCTPLQAFVTLNDVTYVEAARVFAQRILKESPKRDVVSRIEFAMLAALARPATTREMKVLSDVLSDVMSTYSENPKAADSLTRLGESRRSSSADLVELAAWTGVANLILNLDETVTRE